MSLRAAAIALLTLGPIACATRDPEPTPPRPSATSPAKETPPMFRTAAEQEIDRYRRGERFTGVVAPFIDEGKPAEQAIEVLWHALASDPEPVRQEVARLLVAIGLEVDPAHLQGGRMIRDRRLIAILIDAGLPRGEGKGRDACLDALQKHVPPAVLAEYEKPLVADLQRFPDSTAFLVVAKGKLPSAKPVVDQLLQTPRWASDQSALIAGAALGDQATERGFTSAFIAETDPREKARRAQLLGDIGTPTALAALTSELRTDLVIVVQRSFRRSVRLDIVEALAYVYPDNPLFWEGAIKDDRGYEAVEQFAEQHFAVTWKKPRPPFLTIEGFPLPITPP
ncbi:MAG: hypothetical protein R3B70_44765 [Polyangiaceae bacterium]